MDKKIDPSEITRLKVYRGNSQHNFEYKFLKSFVETGNPVYTGNAHDENGNSITFFTPQLISSFFYAEHWLKDEVRSYRGPFTLHPIILEINHQPYKNKIFKSSRAEGHYILGDISAEDIKVVFSKEIGFSQDSSFEDYRKVKGSARELTDFCNSNAPGYSLLQRYKTGQLDIRDLDPYLFGPFPNVPSKNKRKLGKIKEALKCLDDFYDRVPEGVERSNLIRL